MEALLGPTLQAANGGTVSTSSLTGKFIAIYFSAHWCPPCISFTPKLAEFYTRLQAKRDDFEIVFCSSDREEAAFDDYFVTMPWLAVPYVDRDRKNVLSKKFKVQGIPTLVVLSPEGALITSQGRTLVDQDPNGLEFPWNPKSLGDLFGAVELVSGSGATKCYADLQKTDAFAIYFSAHWCPPCKTFTPLLAETYKRMKADGKNFEVVFVSSDRDAAQFASYFADMPWFALPHEESKIKAALSERFNVEGIPCLVVVDGATGNVITTNGRGAVGGDPHGVDFPWRPKPLAKMGPLVADFLNELPVLLVFLDADPSQEASVLEFLQPLAQEYVARFTESGVEEAPLKFTYATYDEELTTRVRQFANLKLGNHLCLLDVPERSKYVRDGPITAEAVREFVDAFLSGTLERISIKA